MREAQVQEPVNEPTLVIEPLLLAETAFPGSKVTITRGKYTDHATVALLEGYWDARELCVVIAWVIAQTDWVPMQAQWCWRGDVKGYAVFLIRKHVGGEVDVDAL